MTRKSRKKTRKQPNQDREDDDFAPQLLPPKWNPPRGPRRRGSVSPSSQLLPRLGRHVVDSPEIIPQTASFLVKRPKREHCRPLSQGRCKQVSEKDIKFRNFLMNRIEEMKRKVEEWLPEADMATDRTPSQFREGRSQSLCIRDDGMMDWQPEATLQIEYREVPQERDAWYDVGLSPRILAASLPMAAFRPETSTWTAEQGSYGNWELRPQMGVGDCSVHAAWKFPGSEINSFPPLSTFKTGDKNWDVGRAGVESWQMRSKMQGDDSDLEYGD